MHFSCRLDINYDKVNGIKFKPTGSWCMLEEHVKDNNYARLHTHSYHCCSEMNFSSNIEVNFDKVIRA